MRTPRSPRFARLSTALAFIACAAFPVAAHPAAAVSVPGAPSLGGTIRIVSDNDFALLAGDANNVSRMILQNDAVWMDQQTAAVTYRISLEANETYLYLLAMGGGGQEDIGGLLNGVDITEIPSGPNGLQRAVGRPGGTVNAGFLEVNEFFDDWRTVGFAGDDVNVAWGKYAAPLAGVQTALTGAVWGDPPPVNTSNWGPGYDVTGKSFFFPDSTAVMFRFKGTALGSGFATAGDSQATVSWTAPASDGGSPILDYTATAYKASDNSPAGKSCTTSNGSTTVCTVTGLTNGTGYYFKITARNTVGSGPASDPTATVTPMDYTPPTLTLGAAAASSIVNDPVFTVMGNEPILCSTLSATSGTDLTVSGGTIASVVQTNPTTCTVTVSTSVSVGSSATVTVSKAAGFSMTDSAGNAQTSLAGSPASTVVAVPATTTTTTTTTTVPTSVAPAASGDPGLSLLTPSTSAPLTTVAPTAKPVVAATTTVPATTTTVKASPLDGAIVASAIPSGVPAPAAPVTDPGNVRATVDGTDATVSVSRVNSEIIVSSNEFAFAAMAVDGKNEKIPLDSTGSLSVDKASKINVRTLGLAPGSDVDAWMMSTPTPLGRVTTDPNGVVKGSFRVPSRIEPGAHRVVVTGITKAGKKVVLSIGVRVADTSKAKVKWSWVFAGLLGLGGLFALVIPARRRRDDDDDFGGMTIPSSSNS